MGMNRSKETWQCEGCKRRYPSEEIFNIEYDDDLDDEFVLCNNCQTQHPANL